MSQTITPYLLYGDGAAAIDFLTRAFGFEEVLRSHSPEGRVWHAELRLRDGNVYLGEPGGGYQSPRSAGQTTVGIHVYVDDVDGHYERARAAGAEIKAEPAEQEYGDRRYTALDLEGHEWFFAQRLHDVAPEEWGATTASPAGIDVVDGDAVDDDPLEGHRRRGRGRRGPEEPVAEAVPRMVEDLRPCDTF